MSTPVTREVSASPLWLRWLPSALRPRIEQRTGLVKIVSNIGWLVSEKVLRMGIGLLVGIWLARYLGPGRYGLLNYGLAFVALFGAAATLGLRTVVVRDIVRSPASAGEILGTSFVLLLLGGLSAFALILGVVDYVRPDDSLARAIIVTLGLTLVFKTGEVVKYWFESQVRSRYAIWAENSIFLAMAAVKIIMIIMRAPLIAFAWAILAEAFLGAASLLAIYEWRGGRLAGWRPRLDRARTLLADSWPLILSGLAVMVYMRVDQVMLGALIGDGSVGVYSAALRISEAWYFVPMTIVASVYPSIVGLREENEELFYARLQQLFDLLVLVSLLIAVIMTFSSHWLVTLLFGQAYVQAGQVLAIHIWTGLFVSLGVASGRWFIIEGLQLLAFQRVLWGAAINVALNFVLIPNYGPTGAAAATLVSQAVAAFVFDVSRKETRRIFRMKAKAFAVTRGLRV